MSSACTIYLPPYEDVCTVVNVHVPKDRITMTHQGYGFVEFASEEDADYAIKIMNMIKLYGKPIRVNKVRGCSAVNFVPSIYLSCNNVFLIVFP